MFDRSTGQQIEQLPQPGVGCETISIHDDALWVCDRAEQTVYCLDRTTGAIRLSALTPFSSPTGIAFYDAGTGKPTCYVAYADEEPYIRDDPNAKFSYQLTFRDRTFIHPLYIHHAPAAHHTLSNSFAIELSYVEELLPLEAVTLTREVGSCGEYVGVLLALSRLNGIACRTIGRYKCPAYPDRLYQPLQPDFNHVWLEFYVPGVGWLPMESNMDDTIERGPYPTRFFMSFTSQSASLPISPLPAPPALYILLQYPQSWSKLSQTVNR